MPIQQSNPSFCGDSHMCVKYVDAITFGTKLTEKKLKKWLEKVGDSTDKEVYLHFLSRICCISSQLRWKIQSKELADNILCKTNAEQCKRENRIIPFSTVIKSIIRSDPQILEKQIPNQNKNGVWDSSLKNSITAGISGPPRGKDLAEETESDTVMFLKTEIPDLIRPAKAILLQISDWNPRNEKSIRSAALSRAKERRNWSEEEN